MDNISFHGTNNASALKIISNGVDVNIGRGELGKGFYSGSSISKLAAVRQKLFLEAGILFTDWQ